jgi:hypothetical protein
MDQIPAELIQAGGNIIYSEFHRLINSIRNKEEWPQQWKYILLYIFIKWAIKLNAVILDVYDCYKLHTESYPLFLSEG